MLIERLFTAKDFSDTFDLDRSTPIKWMAKMNAKLKIAIELLVQPQSSLAGKPELLDHTSKQEFIWILEDSQLSTASKTESSEKQVMIKLINVTKVYIPLRVRKQGARALFFEGQKIFFL